jgi:hypothetical protein
LGKIEIFVGFQLQKYPSTTRSVSKQKVK